MLEEKRDGLWTQTLDLKEFESRGGKLLQQFVPFIERAALADFLENCRKALPDAGDIGHLAFGIRQDIGDAFGIAFDRRSAIPIAPDAKAVLACDFHQVAGFRQNAGEVSVLQVLSLTA